MNGEMIIISRDAGKDKKSEGGMKRRVEWSDDE